MNDLTPIDHSVIKIPEEELKEWQMLLMTSADPAKRQEAFRRVFLSQLDDDNKRKFCFHLLAESNDALKKDIFKALASLGGSEKLLSCLENLISDNEPLRVSGAKQLSQLIGDEDLWAITFIITRLLNDEKSLKVIEEIIKSLTAIKHLIQQEHLSDLISAILIVPDTLGVQARAMLSGWASDAEKGQLLLDEADSHGPGRASEWLLPYVFSSGLRTPAFTSSMILQLQNHEGTLDPSGIGNLIVQIGEGAVLGLMENYSQTIRPVYVMFVLSQIVDQHLLDDEVLNKILDFVLLEIKHGSKEILPTIINFPFARMQLDDDSRRKWVKELFYCREHLTSEHLLNDVDYQIISSGALSVDILYDSLVESDNDEEAIYALKMLSKVLPKNSSKLLQLSEHIDERYENNSLNRGALILAKGRLWARDDYPSGRRQEEVENTLMSLWNKSRTPERFEALSRALPQMTSPLANRTTLSLLDLMEVKLPSLEKKSTLRKVDLIDGAHLEQQLLMAGLSGLNAALLRDDLLPKVQEQVNLLIFNYWLKENAGEYALGPGAMPELVSALAIFVENYPDERSKSIDLLLADLERQSVLKVLPRLWPHLDLVHKKKINKHLLAQLKNIRQLEAEEINYILDVSRVLVEKAEDHIKISSALWQRLNYLRRDNHHQITHFFENNLKIPSILSDS